MRPLIALLPVLGLLCAPARADEVSLVRVWPQWHDADSFQSFYEYKHHHELDGNFTVLRSQPWERGGLYFLTHVKNTAAAFKGASIVVRIISPEATATRVFSFPAEIPGGDRVFEIGLTGSDWAGAKTEPVAWNVEVHAADGRVLAHKSSFLWERPAR
jgi:hypothetical protein